MIGGMDEAGRGPAIGPLVFGLVILNEEQEIELKEAGVKDSKQLTKSRRDEFRQIIENIVTEYAVLEISARDIDNFRLEMTLNELEILKFRQLLQPFSSRITKLQLDAADVNAERFGNRFKDMINGSIDSRHKGDSIFTSVGAASIMAKTKRDDIIEQLQAEINLMAPDLPSFGSGYPTQAKPFLKSYLDRFGVLPDIARKSWKTCTAIVEEFHQKQSSLDDFF